MRDAFAYPEVTEGLYDEMVRRILTVGSPLKIVLFGSRARDEAKSSAKRLLVSLSFPL